MASDNHEFGSGILFGVVIMLAVTSVGSCLGNLSERNQCERLCKRRDALYFSHDSLDGCRCVEPSSVVGGRHDGK